jgi:hypothetical protein
MIRNCYSHHNKTSPDGKDGGGFDFDGGIRFSIMEINLSAYNEGAGYGIFQYAGATEWTDNIIRRNISYNDGSKNSQAGIFMWCDPAAIPMKNFSAVYNTVITSFDHAVAFEPGHYQGFHFARNIFQTGKGKEFITGEYSGAFFDTNLYWSADAPKTISEDPNAIIENPRLYLPSENQPLNEIEKTAWFKASDSLLTFGAKVARR